MSSTPLESVGVHSTQVVLFFEKSDILEVEAYKMFVILLHEAPQKRAQNIL